MEIDMVLVVLGLMAGIAYLAWHTPTQGEARRVPIRVRSDDPRRKRR